MSTCPSIFTLIMPARKEDPAPAKAIFQHNVPENLSVDQLSNRSLKSRTERMAKKLSTCVANQRGPFFHSTWAYDFILEKREKKGHIFVRDQ